MPITEFFSNVLRAPLHNQVWSWGATAADGLKQVLRVWAHEYRDMRRPDALFPDNGYWVIVDLQQYPVGYESPGIEERRRHVAALKVGLFTAGVIITQDPANPDRILTYDDRQLVVIASDLRTVGNEIWARVDRKMDPADFPGIGLPH